MYTHKLTKYKTQKIIRLIVNFLSPENKDKAECVNNHNQFFYIIYIQQYV